MQFPLNLAFRIAEAVGRGHPDRIADQLADKVVDLVLEKDPQAAIGIEVLACKEGITVAGEIDAEEIPPLEAELRQVLHEAGAPDEIPFTFHLHAPSVEITRAVQKRTFADQAVVTGFATQEHPSFLPLPQALAKEVVEILEQTKGLGKDGKVLLFLKENVIQELRISWQIKEEEPTVEELRKLFFSKLPFLNKDSLIVFHPFFRGGLEADTGLNGRKLISDSYGPEIPHGGGALAGKDGGKVDRLGAYFARLIAKSVVRDQGAAFAFVKLTFLFGEEYIHSMEIYTDRGLEERTLNLSKSEIFPLLQLEKPRYFETAVKGHFSGDYPWETLTFTCR